MNLLFNLTELNQLLFDFYTLTKIRIGVFDKNFHEISSYPTRLSNYCRLIRSDEAAYKKCIQCDYNAFNKCKKLHKLYMYRCHAGLTEAVVPILSDNLIVGYIMFGQVLNTDSPTKLWEITKKELKQYNIDMSLVSTAFFQKNNVSSDTLLSASKMLEICASYLHSSHTLVLKEDSLAYKIDNYIGEHIREDLSVPVLCNKFNISKAKLYSISINSYGMGISEHIKQVRIQRAKEYLIDTTLAIYEIADLVGIADYNYFTKVFKNIVGVTPKEFRKEYSIKTL